VRRLPLVAGALAGAGAVILVARKRRGGRERVSLVYEDGEQLSLDGSEPGADRILALAREAIVAAR
jgi:hypothetical protein